MSKTPQVFRALSEWREHLRARSFPSLGFVPTMGALHPGHASLVRRSARENEATLVSIFINPTQFNDPRDLEKYPRTLEADLELLEAAGATHVLYPTFEEMYPDGYRYRVQESELSKTLCGAYRPGHFDGMLTVVLKLLMLAQARRAYFGEKDFQQLKLIEGMANAFFLETEIMPCPLIREEDGLAMSSRNKNLTEEERRVAPLLARALRQGTLAQARAALEAHGFRVDYVEEALGRRLVAAHLGSVRLIDNIPLTEVAGCEVLK